MNTQPHYSVHHPSVYINPSDMTAAAAVARGGGAASPLGVLNFAHWPSGAGADIAAVGDASTAAGTSNRRRGGVGEEAGAVDWEEGSTARRFQRQQQVS